jgi:hypothetical protein
MKLGLCMLAGSVLSAFGIVAFLGGEATPDVCPAVWLGMLGPLAVALCSMVAVNRAYRRDPAGVTRIMIGAFAIKVVFFGGYAILVMKAGWVRPTPFVISFVSYFFAFHVIETIRLRRLIAST